MKYYIYELTYQDTAFYIGRTSNKRRRHREHILGAQNENNTELKYQFIRELNKNGLPWELVVIAEYTDNDENYEDFHIYQALCRGCELTNMTKGSVHEEFAQNTFNGVKTHKNTHSYFEAVRRHTEAIQIADYDAKKRKKQSYNVDKTLFIDELNDAPKLSKGLQALKNRRNK